MTSDDTVSGITLCEVPKGCWFEGTAVRPNGQVLAVRVDAPELYIFDPSDPTKPPRLVHRFDDYQGSITMARLEGYPEAYVLNACNFNFEACRHTNLSLLRVEFGSGDDEAPKSEIIKRLDDEAGHSALCSVTNRILLFGDGYKGCIWKFDMVTGEREELISDPTTLGPANAEELAYGLTRIRYVANYLWYNNLTKGLVCRIPVAVGDGPDGHIRITGAVEIVSDEAPNVDDIKITPDGRFVYGTDLNDGILWKLTVDPVSGKGRRQDLVTNAVALSAVELLYGADGSSETKPKLFALCSGAADAVWVKSDQQEEKGVKNGGEIKVEVEIKQEITRADEGEH